jgi:serine-type D-Ala-D-Ala carboxypeptidase/endopeptidase (penicillin-binding protein 4)
VRLGRVAVALVALLLITALATGLVTGWFAMLAREGLTATGLWRSNAPSTIPPGALSGADQTSPAPPSPAPTTPDPTGSAPTSAGTPGPSDPAGLPPVLAPAPRAEEATASRVQRRVAAIPRTDVGSRFGGLVVDATTGRTLYRHKAGTGFIPASTAKVLTATTVLHLLGPDHRFTTQARLQGRTLYLIGGGDPYLMRRPQTGRASVKGLAEDTAEALRRLGVPEVRVRYDAGLFRGPSWNPRWPDNYASEVGRISALSVDGGRERLGFRTRSRNPARDAAAAFAAALRRQQITVRSVIAAERAPESARVVAAASSMPLSRIVEIALMVSDNDATEVLFRQAALAAKQPATFVGGGSAVRKVLTDLGAWSPEVRLYDGSGLARQNRVPPTTLATVIRLSISADHHRLRPVLTGLPVAGVEGSLRRRYADDRSQAGRGLVRGKTGTLTKVHSLAGYVQTRDGHVLVYAFLVNQPKNDFAAVVWLDRVTAALSTCGC